jgi:nicotinamidase/pyrazinamidase
MGREALLVIDVQNDFCPGGALPVAGGDLVVPRIRALARRFHAAGHLVVATRDWHPPDHCSFDAQGGTWPVHCVAGSHGSRLHPGLELPDGTAVVDKADRRDVEAYSGFTGTDLEARLRDAGVTRVSVCGLATDYCVKHTVLDALRAGFDVIVVEDAIRAVDAQPGDGRRALAEMEAAGASRAAARSLPGPGSRSRRPA